jgi:hypothetical protein
MRNACRSFGVVYVNMQCPNQLMSRNQCLPVRGWVFERLSCWEERKKIPEPAREQLQLLKVSMFPLSAVFSQNSHLATPHPHCSWLSWLSKRIVCSWRPVYCRGEMHKGTVSWTSVIPISGWMVIPTALPHRIAISVSVDILPDQLLGPVAPPNRSTSAVNYWFRWMICQCSWNKCSFVKDKTEGAPPHFALIFSAWTVDRG